MELMDWGKKIRSFQDKTEGIAMGQCIEFQCPQPQEEEYLLCEIHLSQIFDRWKPIYRRTATWENMKLQVQRIRNPQPQGG